MCAPSSWTSLVIRLLWTPLIRLSLNPTWQHRGDCWRGSKSPRFKPSDPFWTFFKMIFVTPTGLSEQLRFIRGSTKYRYIDNLILTELVSVIHFVDKFVPLIAPPHLIRKHQVCPVSVWKISFATSPQLSYSLESPCQEPPLVSVAQIFWPPSAARKSLLFWISQIVILQGKRSNLGPKPQLFWSPPAKKNRYLGPSKPGFLGGKRPNLSSKLVPDGDPRNPPPLGLGRFFSVTGVSWL